MGYTVPTSPTSGSVATSSWADIVAGDIIFLAQKPYGKLLTGAGTSVPTSTWTKISTGLDFEGNGMTASSSSLVVPTTGIYSVVAFTAWDILSTAQLGTGVVIGSGSVPSLQTAVATNGTAVGSVCSGLLQLAAGNTVSLFGWQNSGSTLTTDAAGSFLSLMFESNQ